MSARIAAAARAEAARVHEAVASSLPELLAELETWVNLDTPTGAASHLDRLAAMLAHACDRYGLHPELVPTGDEGLYLHARLEGSGRRRVALLCHHDTVFPLGTAEARPFSHDGRRVYGPGVADMKGGIAVALHAARALADGPRSFGVVELVSAPDEEARSWRPATLERLRGFDAVLCMECGRVDGSVVSSRKGGRWFRFRATGRPAHAGVAPDDGRNAVHAICLEAMRLMALHRARPAVTLQVTQVHGGAGLNTVPGEALLTGDLRAPTARDLEWALDHVRNAAEHDGVELAFDDLGGPPPFERTEAVARLASTAVRLGGALGHAFGEATTGGVSDGSWTAWEGIPTLDGLGPVGGLDHTPEEYAELGTFASRAGVVAGLVAAVEHGLLDGTAGS